MRKLRTLENSPKLRELNSFGLFVPNETQWTGKIHTLRRFLRIESHIQNIPEVNELLSAPFVRRHLMHATKDFKKV